MKEMKVLCINDSKNGNRRFDGPSPKMGVVYTVTREEDYCGTLSYELAEFGPMYLYSAWRFAPLSDLDETEIHNLKQNEYA